MTIYLDDILVHSKNEVTHKEHLEVVFERLSKAGLTLRGAKCHIGMTTAQYLGHVFCRILRMFADPKKVQPVVDWPIPTNPTEVCQFWG